MFKSLLQFYQTVARLKPIQVTYRARRLILPQRIPARAKDVQFVSTDLKEFISHRPVNPVINNIIGNLLSKIHEHENPWRNLPCSDLQLYQLHSFDYIFSYSGSEYADSGIALIRNWIENNPPGSSPGWDPFPVSLRTVNWLKFLCLNDFPANEKKEITESIHHQLLQLERNVEYHILGNHLIKNGRALVFGGLFFRGKEASRWLDLGMDIIKREAREQVLEDGAHFELSPMYHCHVLEDFIDICSLLQSVQSPPEQYSSTVHELKSVIVKMLAWLSAMQHPDGQIPLFNDSVLNEAVSPEQLHDYASRTGVSGKKNTSSINTLISLEESGYYVVNTEKLSAIIDAGHFSPSFLPAHGHCDALSYELSAHGERLVVDSGVYDYHDPERRPACRSTAAHNTVVVNSREQTDIWNKFRAGRRVTPLKSILTEEDSQIVFLGRIAFASGGIEHERKIQLDETALEWHVHDSIHGKAGTFHACSYLHIAPGAVVERDKTNENKINIEQGKYTYVVRTSGRINDIDIKRSVQWPRFWTEVKNTTICFSATVTPGEEFGYSIFLQPRI